MLRLWLLTQMIAVRPHVPFRTLAGDVYVRARVDSDSVRKCDAWFQKGEEGDD